MLVAEEVMVGEEEEEEEEADADGWEGCDDGAAAAKAAAVA